MKGSGTGASGTDSPLRLMNFNTDKADCLHDSPDSSVFHSRSSGGPRCGASARDVGCQPATAHATGRPGVQLESNVWPNTNKICLITKIF